MAKENQRQSSKRKAAKMAALEIDRLGDQIQSSKERAKRKRHLIKNPREFHDIRVDQPNRK